MREISQGIAEPRLTNARCLLGRTTSSTLLTAGLVTVGVAVLTVGSWLSVPFYPVPLTMQTLAVLLVGGLLGPKLGVAAVAGYLVLGLSGAPVFHAGMGGPAVLLGPTGGYLVGFLPAALLMGLLSRRAHPGDSRRSSPLRTFGFLAAGTVLAEAAIYALGVPWLAVAYAGGSISRAVAIGVLPYLLGDLLKMGVAVGALRMGTRALQSRELLPF